MKINTTTEVEVVVVIPTQFHSRKSTVVFVFLTNKKNISLNILALSKHRVPFRFQK
jgi:hypothetical protein